MKGMEIALRNKILTVLGVFFLVVGIVAIFNAFLFSEASILFWFCYVSLPVAGIGLLARNASLIKSQLYILAIPDLIWTIDFASYLINHQSLLGVVDYVFMPGFILPKIVTLQHLIAVPIMFYTLILLKTKRDNSWKISVFQVFVMYLITRFLTLRNENINCVYDLCGKYYLNLSDKLYPVLWFFVALLMIYISRKIFIKLYEKIV